MAKRLLAVTAAAVFLTAAASLAQRSGRDPAAAPQGVKVGTGSAYVTAVMLRHQPVPADNGRIILAHAQGGMDGIPIYESRDGGASFTFIRQATDAQFGDLARCNLHYQPHLAELPRDAGALKAGTVMLSASTVCNGADGRILDFHLQLYASTDFGRTWRYVGTYADGTAAAPVWEPHLLALDDGKLVEFYSDETHKADGYNQMLGHKLSTDDGKSWGPEVYDTAIKGGVERPGMVTVDRMQDGRYVYTYEDVQGPVNSQVHIKFSEDGLHWGNPENRGTPIHTQGGQYPINTPNVHWFPIGGPKGILLVSARNTAGGPDLGANDLFWNNDNGAGPWWEVPAPVQKLPGNDHVGWTQAMLLKNDGRILQVASSANPANPTATNSNDIIANAEMLDFRRYEAEDARQQGSSIMRDLSMSNGAKSRMGAKEIGKLTFDVFVPKTGIYSVAVNYAGIGFNAVPRLAVNGRFLSGNTAPAPLDPVQAARRAPDLGTRGAGEHFLFTAATALKAGANTITIAGGAYALDIDYLELTPR